MGLFTGREVANPRPPSCTLMDAVRDDDRELVSKTLEAGEDVKQVNAYLRTPLHKAAYYSGAPEVLLSLLERGADVNARDKGNWTPLHLATRNGHLEAVSILIEAGAELDVQDSKHGWTPLHLAVITGQMQAAKLLVKASAGKCMDVEDKSGMSVTALLEEMGVDLSKLS